MFNFIENLKTKPEHVKKRFAFLTSFSITLVIFVGWLMSYNVKSSTIVTDKDSTIDKPVSSLTASVSGLYDDLKSMIFGSNKFEYSSNAIQITGNKQ